MYRKPTRNSWFFCGLDFYNRYDNLEVPTTGFMMNKLSTIVKPLTEAELIKCLNAQDAFVFEEDNPFVHEAESSNVNEEEIEFVDWEDNPFK